MQTPAPAFRSVSHYPFHVSENPETYDLALTRAEDSEGVQKPFGLYLVTFTRKREGKRPLVFSVHCLAPDERGAILQTENLAFPDSGPLLDEEQRASLSATASRVPFYIRGWSANTF